MSGPGRYEVRSARGTLPDLHLRPDAVSPYLSSWWRDAPLGHPWVRDDESPREVRPADKVISTPDVAAAPGRRPCIAVGRGRA